MKKVMSKKAVIKRSRASRIAGLFAALACLSLLFASGASATQTHLFKETFGPVQQPSFPAGFEVGRGATALDTIQSSGDLLVLGGPLEDGTLNRFKPNGEPDPFSALGTNVINGAKGPGGLPCAEEPASCDATPVNGLKGIGTIEQIAVDESAGPAAGDIYVLEFESNFIDVFAADGHYLGKLNKCAGEKFGQASGIAVDQSGNLYVSDREKNAIHKFTPAASFPKETDCSAANDIKAVERPDAIAVGSGPTAGYIFVGRFFGTGGLSKVKLSNGELAYPILEGTSGGSNDVVTVAVDPANGHLFAAQKGNPEHVDEYDASGASSATKLSTTVNKGLGIAFAKSSGDIYLADGTEHVQTYSAAIVTQPAVTTEPATGITPSKATLHGTVDPDGQELTECVFEYVNSHSYQPNASSPYAAGGSVPCVESPAAIGEGHGPVSVQASFSEPVNLPSPIYHFRLSAQNSNGVKVFGKDQEFETKHIAKTRPATAITGTTATLNGTVNPDGSAVTECQFEYLAVAEFVNEVQTVTLSGATGGTFKLGFEGDETGGQGEGRLSSESTTVSEVSVSSGAFVKGELITGTGIKPGTTIAGVSEANGVVTSMILSQPTEAVVPAGKTALATELTSDATAEAVGGALNALPALKSIGRVNVTGADGGPYTISFEVGGEGDVPQLSADASGLTPPGAEATVATQTQGKGFPQGAIVPCEESAGEIGEGEDAVPVEAEISGLQKGTKYEFRFTGANALDGVEHGIGNPFTTQLESNVETKPASLIGGSLATLNGTVNPGGAPVSECLFEYVDAAGYEPSAPNPYATGSTVPCVESEADIGAGTEPFAVHANVTGLSTASDYHFRLIANPGGISTEGEDELLVTAGPLIESEWAVSVGAAEATLAAEIDPRGAATTYHLEYGKAGGPFEAVTPESEPIGSGSSAVKVEAHVGGLQQGADYAYRFVATSGCNALNPSELCVFEGPEERFHTATTQPEAPQTCPNEAFRGGASARLPDCRAYEMVSPVDKNGGNIGVGPTNYSQASLDGNRMTFAAIKPFAGAEAGPFESEYIASRVDGVAWQTKAINPPRNSVSLYALGFINFQFKAFSPDLCSGWFMQDSTLNLVEGAPAGLPNFYRRDLCGGGGYELLTTAPPRSFHPEYVETGYYPEPGGFSADGTRTVFRANDALTPDAAPESNVDPEHLNTFQVYLAQRGAPLRLVSVLPSSSSAAGQASTSWDSIGTRTSDASTSEPKGNNLVGAVSQDAERIFWTASATKSLGAVYLRINASAPESAHDNTGKCTEPSKACTYPVSELASPQQAQFWQGNPGGTRAIFSVAPSPTNMALFEFIANEGPEGLETEAKLIAKGFKAFMGASNDVSHVYFVSTEDLAQGASAGANNLYLYERGSGFKFIGALSSEDGNGFVGTKGAIPSPASIYPYKRTSRVSPDGAAAAFISNAPLTGYDNAATNAGGRPAAEVYLYDATADGGAGRLLCVSCNPSGTRPVARKLGEGDNGNTVLWGAAEIPGWTSAFQPTRALSSNGKRVFFNSYDALLPADTNGAEDVYEWEAPGEGSCDEASAAYFSMNGGCIYLISSGKSPGGSEFFDATPEGADVFFATLSSLLPEDNGLIDVYDARVNGGLPEPPGIPASCEGEACQGAQGAPQDPTPASSNLKGRGNLNEAKGRHRCSKAKVRRKGRCVPRRHKKRHAKHKRHHRKHHRHANADRRASR
jgi:NHL repeat-containing protein